MSARRLRRRRADLFLNAPPLSAWPAPGMQSPDFTLELRTSYCARRHAIELYWEKTSALEIKKKTGIPIHKIRRLVLRALELNPETKQIVGFWACVDGHRAVARKHQRHREFKKTIDGKGLSGILAGFFKDHPRIEKELGLFVRKRHTSDTAPIAILTPRLVYQCFIGLCREEKIGEDQWPYTSKRCGYEAIRRWFHKTRFKDLPSAVDNVNGAEAGALARHDLAAIGSSPRPTSLAYGRCELDEHHLDALWEILYPLGNSRFETIATTRLWLLALLECSCDLILSAGISHRIRYDSSDVKKLVLRGLDPPPRLNLSHQSVNYCYANGAAYPGELTELRGHTWQTLALDRDASHLSEETLDAIGDVLGCGIANERLGDGTARDVVEAFFGGVTQYCQGMVSATGNHPYSPVRRDPEAAAVKWHLVAHLAEEFLDLLCRNKNVTPSERCGGLSPLQLMHEKLMRSEIFHSPIGALAPANLWRLLPVYPATLTRLRTTGPLGVNLFGRYSSIDLAKDPQLLYCNNHDVRVYVQEDARYAFVVPNAFPERVFQVVIEKRWLNLPHTLEWRQLCMRFEKNKAYAGRASVPQLMFGLNQMLGEAGKTDAAAAMMLARTISFMDRYGGRNVLYTSSTPQQRDQLAEWMHKTEGQGSNYMEPAMIASQEKPSNAPHIGARKVFDPFGLA